jgi:ssDNA-binding Zn-finger/Zn-ribbon topoisomerase 1
MKTPTADPKDETICPKCGSALGALTTTPTGRKLKRCTNGTWNPKTRKTDGCDYVLWMPFEPETLDEKCPKCSAPLVYAITRFGKKMKKCSTGGWDTATRKATGCDYVQWINGTTEPLEEECPECGQPLVLYTTASGKKMKKCSTSGWDRVNKVATGCTYVQWLKAGQDEPPEE